MINYIIGRYWENGSLCTFTQFNSNIFRASLKDALKHAEGISEYEGKTYKVFQIVELKDDATT